MSKESVNEVKADPGDVLEFYVNGRKIREENASPEITLLQYLRKNLLLTGTKTACDQGGCGACTVMLSRYDVMKKEVAHFTVNACLIPICYVHGHAVTTVEGVGSTRNGLHPIQKSLVESYGLQCGFCTPGMIMTMYCLLRNTPNPSQEDMERALEGNLCRCTGYRPIIDAFKQCPMGVACCQNQKKNTSDTNAQKTLTGDRKSEVVPIYSTQDAIFPPELKLTSDSKNVMVSFQSNGWTWFRPVTLAEVCDLLTKYPDARLVLGGTAIVPAIKNGKLSKCVLICCTHVKEMNQIEINAEGCRIGAAVTFGNLERELNQIKKSGTQSNIYQTVLDCIRWIAADQIRNTATIGGHVMVADPYSDLNPVLLAVGAVVTLVSRDSTRQVKIDSSFFRGKLKTVVKPDEVLISVYIPNSGLDFIQFYKNPPRRGFAYGITNSCMALTMEKNKVKVKQLDIFFGGMSQTTLMAKSVIKDTALREWNDKLLNDVLDCLVKELSTNNKTEGGKYKTALALGYFFKFYNYVKSSLDGKAQLSDTSSASSLSMEPCQGIQVFEAVPKDQPEHDGVGRPIPHVSSNNIVTGEARYTDDIPSYKNEVFVALVTSSKARAKILKVDTAKALQVAGVIGCVDYKDVPGSNKYGILVPDEELFQENEVTAQSDVICGIVAESRNTARKAAELVTVEYEELTPVLTIEDAMAKNSTFDYPVKPMTKGDVEEGLQSSDHVIQGELSIDSQEHFYMETQSSLVVPSNEQNEVEVFCASQGTNITQATVSQILGIPRNRVVSRIKRCGGAFGGKETSIVKPLGAAAVAAYKVGRPARCILDRKLDFKMTGKRHPIYAKYKIGIKDSGKIEVLHIQLYSDAGHTVDMSPLVMENCMRHIDGCYSIPNLYVEGHVCKTNTVSNTAFRGFGSPQAVFMIENIIEQAARYIDKPASMVKEMNILKDGDVLHSGKTLTNVYLRKCWDECKTQSGYDRRTQSIQDFNSKNRWKKRGIGISPVKFHVGIPAKSMNQAGAFVNIYLDGSVLLAHGGIECGQGINTKMIQVASRALGVPVDIIFTSETSSSTVPNATTTGGSIAADVNGMAILEACTILKRRLQPFKDEKPNGSWNDWVNDAYMDRVSLSATGYASGMVWHAIKPGLTTPLDLFCPAPVQSRDNTTIVLIYTLTEGFGLDHKTGEGEPFNYLTGGVGCTEVEIDCLTGEHQVLSTDIVMDVGKSLNPIIDIGQIEGGFIQGYGLMTMEKLIWTQDGKLISKGPLEYKIPGVRNIPREFRVSLLKDCPNEKAIYSSRGIGEPPCLLGVSVFLAIKNAIYAARKEVGLKDYFRLDAPATPERIRMACQDDILKRVC